MKTRVIAIGLFLILGSGLYAQTAPAGNGTSGSPYQIATLSNLYWISQNSGQWDKYYIQIADIDASATSGWNSNAGWPPIGNGATQFTGSYDGQGHFISGLTINRSSAPRQGLFGYTVGATIQNLYVTSVNMTGNSSTGSLVGYCYGGDVVNCQSSGSVNGYDVVGGLVGSFTGTMSTCYSTVSVSGNTQVGGLVGCNYFTSTVSNCYSTGSVSGKGYIGGLVGYNNGTATGTATVSNCYSRGSVTQSSGSYSDIGGFAGNNYYGTIEYCYSTGYVICGSSIDKGFVGSNSGTCTADFFDSQTSGQTLGAGATAKTTAEMKTHTTFTDAGWDFEVETANGTNNYWDMDYSGTINNGYPFLSWQNGGDVSLPVELSFVSARCEGQAIVLEWVTESEVDNLGFILERSAGADWQTIASYQTHDELKGQGNTSSRTEYSFADANVEPGKEYAYRLSDVSTTGEITVYASLSIKLDNLPETTVMENAYPNPFNPQTYIAYHLAEDTDVNITVFDTLGRSVKALYNGHQLAGSYHVYWNATNESRLKSPSGGYIIRMQTENTTQVQKVMLVK